MNQPWRNLTTVQINSASKTSIESHFLKSNRVHKIALQAIRAIVKSIKIFNGKSKKKCSSKKGNIISPLDLQSENENEKKLVGIVYYSQKSETFSTWTKNFYLIMIERTIKCDCLRTLLSYFPLVKNFYDFFCLSSFPFSFSFYAFPLSPTPSQMCVIIKFFRMSGWKEKRHGLRILASHRCFVLFLCFPSRCLSHCEWFSEVFP